jgi:PEP-CTERM motif
VSSSTVDSSLSLENQAVYAQFLAASWTQTGSYTNVGISAVLGDIYSGDTGTAYLATSVGPGANTIASNLFSFPSATDGTVSLFSGLSLGPGTYYLVLAGTPSGAYCNSGPAPLGCGTYWDGSTVPTIVSGLGVTGNGFYATGNEVGNLNPPTGNFSNSLTNSALLFSVDGNSTTVTPEPGTVLLFGSGLLAVWAKLRRHVGNTI